MSKRKNAVSIELHRWEGLKTDDFSVHTIHGRDCWVKANALLANMARTVPLEGCHKVGVVVEFEDLQTYQCRYDLKSLEVESPDLAASIMSLWTYFVDPNRSQHPTSTTRTFYKELRSNYQIG